MNYDKITGDKAFGYQTSQIGPPNRKDLSPELLNRFEHNQNYWEALELLRYDHPLRG